ncbi:MULTISPECIES: endonuclease/exonuclease/phosphatase family protein [Bacillus]|uniref:endonuclease/exonuclease/phosphatase family protein n=1 Tax=Bacillus TaxID=1386 RepID=UPI00041F018E|nr:MULTISPECIES: endonuclease/exonuclease/phosphatase family protein [Bacillus]QHZ47136.1 endonuclease [Bacillus sp. NSP9.1]
MNITIMTFNIHHGKGSDKRLDLERIAQVIAESDADIVGLNEVDQHFSKRSHYEDQIGWLASQLKMHHAFSPSLSLSTGPSTPKRRYGNALLTRFPIVQQQHHLFNLIAGLIEGRSLLEADVEIGGRILRIFVTHLSLNPFLHRKQTDFLLQRIRKREQPAVVMGDFNMKPHSRDWNKITGELRDVWKEAGDGQGSTYPSHRPNKRLDYLFISPSLHASAAEVAANDPAASDHLPLLGRIDI